MKLTAATLDESLRGVVGDRTAKVLAGGLDLHTVGDLLHHYPRRYATRGELTDLAGLSDGEDVTVMAEVVTAHKRRMRQRKGDILEVVVTDGRGRLTLTFFGRGAHGPAQELLPGVRGLFAGRISTYGSKRQLTHPQFKVLPRSGAGGADAAREFADELIPVYPATKGLESWKIAECVSLILDTVDVGADSMPEPVRKRHGLVGLREAYHGIHRPTDMAEAQRARKRLKWDEAFLVQAALARRRRAAATLPARPRPRAAGGLLDAFDARLPFTLTRGQREVGAEIAADLEREHPMHRLLQGDVGAGKTVVALRAMLQVVDAGGQTALLAPTEVLAQQHYRSIMSLLGPLAEAGQLGGADDATKAVLLTGSQGAKARRVALLDAASGAAGIVVGTHALLQEHVRFADLGLVVVDEQHRFGVEQRDALREKVAGGRPHVLVMTATPIPRTVAMTVFGDLDTSTLAQLPEGRAEIKTHVVPPERPHFFQRAWERIREEIEQGRQAYIVCPRIGDQEGDEGDLAVASGPAAPAEERSGAEADDGERRARAVVDVLPMLEGEWLPGLRIGVLHGKLPADDKDAAMRRFAAGELDVLLATTVIEVGVDVPNATVMMIMDADRFGVSQLHQLRGRVGRGELPGLCLLVTESPDGTKARARLDAVAATTNGFELARLDLEQRREGDVLGAAQSGRRSSLRLLTLLKDEALILKARDEAAALIDDDPELERHPELAAELAALVDDDRAEFLEKA
ncbi:MAG TPA: ATP-dependent DNA helicase RecG [Streptosporangiaceae bacterium]|nr:ATP-dependent DNA helicase RecG [Streptosporangiaceae bacterium]